MWLSIAALAGGMLLLIISAERFVEGAAATAKLAGLSPLLIGMVVIGFGSSMPEMVISALAAMDGNPGLAIGNALGSNIANIALILGATALISPIAVRSSVVVTELPALTGLTAAAGALMLIDMTLSRSDGVILVGIFGVLMAWSIYQANRTPDDELAADVEKQLADPLSPARAIAYLVVGLIFLVISSRIMVWGGVEIALALGVSDLIVGLTIVAIGTSLPELASSIAAVRKGEHELALGNVIGSNMFNTSIVLGIAGVLAPTAIERDILVRDFPVLGVLTLILFFVTYWFRGPGTGLINRTEGACLLLAYAAYTSWLVMSAVRGAA